MRSRVETARARAEIAGRTNPLHQPGHAVRFGLFAFFAAVALHCVVTVALLVQVSRFILALTAAGGMAGVARGQVAGLLRTGLLWVAITVVACAIAVLTLRRKRAAVRARDVAAVTS